MNDDVTSRFWAAPEDAFFTREEIAAIRRCSIAKLEREAWLGKGISHIKDGARTLYSKKHTVEYLRDKMTSQGADTQNLGLS